MKILFCSPCTTEPGYASSGINRWAQIILSYYSSISGTIDNLQIFPIAFDRKTLVTDSYPIFKRVINGIKEVRIPVNESIRKMDEVLPDVMHLCTSGQLGLIKDFILVRAARKRGIKVALHIHRGTLPSMLQQRSFQWKMFAKLMKMCDVVIVMDKTSESVLKKVGYTNIVYLPNPLGMDIISQVQENEGKLQRHPRTLLFVGHVYLTKGVYELVRGCSQIPNIELRIVGKCSNEVKDDLQLIANEIGDGKWLKFVGEIPHYEIIREFLSAGMFVFPSYTEGFPNVILEAMACNCPIVATNVGAIPEMLDINNDSCGKCILPKNSDEVYKSVSLLINDEIRKREFAEKAKKRVMDCYAVPHVWSQLYEIWRSLY